MLNFFRVNGKIWGGSDIFLGESCHFITLSIAHSSSWIGHAYMLYFCSVWYIYGLTVFKGLGAAAMGGGAYATCSTPFCRWAHAAHIQHWAHAAQMLKSAQLRIQTWPVLHAFLCLNAGFPCASLELRLCVCLCASMRVSLVLLMNFVLAGPSRGSAVSSLSHAGAQGTSILFIVIKKAPQKYLTKLFRCPRSC